MASISVVLLGLNPETRLAAVVDYLKKRGVSPAEVRPALFQGSGKGAWGLIT